MTKLMTLLAVLFCLPAFGDIHIFDYDDILLTPNGIYVEHLGQKVPVQSICYIGKRQYAADFVKKCKQCSSYLTPSGFCSNQFCDRKGPRLTYPPDKEREMFYK